MRHHISFLLRSFTLTFFLLAAAQAQTTEVRGEFDKLFENAGVTGSFSMYDLKKDTYTLCHPEQFRNQFTPASTFKICNSLIGLESGVIKDENFVIKWDGVERSIKKWNKDHDLKTAYKNSSVPYYQELARRVGPERMYLLLNKAGYGNADTSGGLDRFWLDGGLRVSPQQQIDFLKRLYENKLPFSKRSMDIAKRIMIEEESAQYTLRTKTGLGEQDGRTIGWYVGYVTTMDNVYFFATCIQSTKPDEKFAVSRKSITRSILTTLEVLPSEINK